MRRCDIIIPVWNQLEFTRECIESIRKNTSRVDYGLIIIDNASDERTSSYLESLKGPNVSLVRNEKNMGFVKAANRGMTVSSAHFLCILNNDTIVTKDWLTIMINVASSSPDIGIVNPSSNNLGQRPGDNESIESFAEGLRPLSDKFIELGSAVGFCMLIKRAVIERIGYFDEVYGMGNFEDTDFSRRAIKEGYKCVRACGAYVHHREGASFARLNGRDENFRRNREIYEFRWGKPKRVAYVLDSCDANTSRMLETSAVKLARGGSWVWYFLKGHLAVPPHSNIIAVEIGADNFYLDAIFKILKKKKRFDEIYVGGERLFGILKWLSFIHKAKVERL